MLSASGACSLSARVDAPLVKEEPAQAGVPRCPACGPDVGEMQGDSGEQIRDEDRQCNASFLELRQAGEECRKRRSNSCVRARRRMRMFGPVLEAGRGRTCDGLLAQDKDWNRPEEGYGRKEHDRHDVEQGSWNRQGWRVSIVETFLRGARAYPVALEDQRWQSQGRQLLRWPTSQRGCEVAAAERPVRAEWSVSGANSVLKLPY